MKERPILFSAPMVRAILDGRKTQTRRVVKHHSTCVPGHQAWEMTRCQYGQLGDRLWVRENGWERPERTPKMMREGADTWPKFAYDAEGWSEQDHADFKAWGFKRRPSIHMPKWASRITLEVVGVRVERLQDISEEDAKAEGVIEGTGDFIGCFSCGSALSGTTARECYSRLWEIINGPGSWDANPWVWVIEFRRSS